MATMISLTHWERWRRRRVKLRYRFVNDRWRPKPKHIKNFIRETERYLAWRQTVPSDEELEAAECCDLIERVRAGGWIEPFDGDMPQDDSDDSYEFFMRLREAYRRTINGEGIR